MVDDPLLIAGREFRSRLITGTGKYPSFDVMRNAVVASGEAADMKYPPRAVAIDANPNSPTYWHGAFGKIPRFFNSPLLWTQPAAERAAANTLARAIGASYTADLTAVPVNPINGQPIGAPLHGVVTDEHLAAINSAGVVARGHKLQQLFDAAGVLQASQDDKISAGTLGHDDFTRVVNCGQ